MCVRVCVSLCACVRAYVYFRRDSQLFRATETCAASRRMAEKQGRYLAGQAKETKQSQMRSPEEYMPASSGKKKPGGRETERRGEGEDP